MAVSNVSTRDRVSSQLNRGRGLSDTERSVEDFMFVSTVSSMIDAFSVMEHTCFRLAGLLGEAGERDLHRVHVFLPMKYFFLFCVQHPHSC